MKHTLLILLLACAVVATAQPKIDVDKQMKLSLHQYKGLLTEFTDTTLFPQSVNPDGTYKKMKSEWWCTGFFGGSLWYLYEYTKDPAMKAAAEKWTLAVKKEQYNTGTHDLGFMLYCSFGNGLRLTNNPAYKPILLTGAQSLSTRFNPKVGVIKSWNDFHGYKYPVIIDNMMNLEFLFWAAKASGNKKFYDLSVTHADNTLKNHYRPDYSSYHVLCYDSVGNVIARKTAQGFADESAWARGQAWGLYGYVVMFRETKDKKYLDQAVHIADFFTHHPNLPNDKIPYWDFNSTEIPNDVRDASSAAIAASALLELSGYVKGEKSKAYFTFAEDVLQSLSSPEYFAPEGNHYFLLKHSTGHKPAKSEIDTPIIYADYYYLEGLLRYNKITKKKK
ncbi:glycoside hydrolase family 88 protein [Chryseolinea lacunae]|uniref:Glycoside hydrolase family 88 protein n=1 Tax=Chryseolinea lacunae TaxID=2801331 RepID=A0ABS1KP17_9BACT|nr:glycoside hydrolase family 88 protein [Chryseolinea lacunae]MBL0740437.1 glycoside hydrolase family 88 protein [Chryseolinea lacunae]